IKPINPITGTLTLFEGFTSPYTAANPITINILRGRADVYEFDHTDGTLYLENAVPEPASLVMLGIGALALLRRRRRQV
ncbi:MAG: PEP-CTERM sorting domain-containing protein, partial [Candidatus Pacebacteria bacterium]|nr:PEP-CTERM sorting domain-containing protein [Candidatus Paceibacterota bacterium]